MQTKKLYSIPEELKNQIFYSVSDFECARWKSLLVYAEAICRRSPLLPEEVRENNAEGIANKALSALLDKNYGKLRRCKYADEMIIVPEGEPEASYEKLYAFDAFAAIVKEVSDADQLPEMCFGGEAGRYPFHYAFTSGKQEIIYRVIIYGADAFSRLGFLEETYIRKKDRRYVTLLVVTDDYSWEEFSNITIPGRYRIALITRGSRKKHTYSCRLTEILEEKHAI